jgi:hypothetical protein
MLPLNEVPSCGIASLINLESKEHYTLYSSSLPIELAKVIESLRRGTHSSKSLIDAYHANKLTFKVLDTKPIDYSLYSLRAEYSEWLREFASKGFSDLRPGHKAPTYRIIKKIYNHFTDGRRDPLVYVIAVSKRNNKLVLGVFNTLPEADDWVNANFKDVYSGVPIFHDGELSKAYRNEYGDRLIKLSKNIKARNRSKGYA